MSTKMDRNVHDDGVAHLDGFKHLGQDASSRELARALDALGAVERAGAPVGMSDRIARGSMPSRSGGLRLDGASRRSWAARMRPMLAMAAGITTIASAGVYFGIQVARVIQGPTLAGNGASGGATPGEVARSGAPDTTRGTAGEAAANPTPRIEIAQASSDVETWLAVGEEMDALMDTTAADLSATASALEERATASFAADDWYSESSL